MRRDNNRCVVSGVYDTEQWKELTDQEQLAAAESDWTEAAYVIPLSLGSTSEEQVRVYERPPLCRGSHSLTLAPFPIARGQCHSLGIHAAHLPGGRIDPQHRRHKQPIQLIHAARKSTQGIQDVQVLSRSNRPSRQFPLFIYFFFFANVFAGHAELVPHLHLLRVPNQTDGEFSPVPRRDADAPRAVSTPEPEPAPAARSDCTYFECGGSEYPIRVIYMYIGRCCRDLAAVFTWYIYIYMCVCM